jgi:hypothetical protein
MKSGLARVNGRAWLSGSALALLPDSETVNSTARTPNASIPQTSTRRGLSRQNGCGRMTRTFLQHIATDPDPPALLHAA